MLDARPGFIIKFLKRSLIVNLFKTRAFDCQSAVFDIGKVILNHINYSTDVTTRTVVYIFIHQFSQLHTDLRTSCNKVVVKPISYKDVFALLVPSCCDKSGTSCYHRVT
jgi:hypothetical protein